MQKKTTMTKKDNYAIINVHNQDNHTLSLLCSIIILSGSTIQYPDNFLFLHVCSANEKYLLTTHLNPRLV